MSSKALSKFWVALACGLAVSLPARAVPMIDNGPQNGTVSFFGPVEIQTYGSVFRVSGPETQLNQFSFSLNNAFGTDFTVRAYVAPWNTGTSRSGSALFTSADFIITGNQFFTVNTGGLALVDSQTYVAYFSSLVPAQSGSLGAEWAASVTPYTLDNRLVINNSSTLAGVSSTQWSAVGVSSVFNAVFSAPPAPEIQAATAGLPVTVSLLLLAVLGGARRRA